MKYCIDCKWHEPYYDWKFLLLKRGRNCYHDECYAPENVYPIQDLVCNKKKRWISHCSDSRGSDIWCGGDAKWFDSK